MREGFEHATGGIILIQDADLEYSVDDYPALLDADHGRSRRLHARVAGTCRGKPMRDDARHRAVATVVNAAHWVFLGDVQRHVRHAPARPVHDVQGVPVASASTASSSSSDRFDFDWELVGQARAARVPRRSRSRSSTTPARSRSGKKVRFFRDPPTWVWACLRFRFCRLPERRRLVSRRRVGDDRHLPQPDADGPVAKARAAPGTQLTSRRRSDRHRVGDRLSVGVREGDRLAGRRIDSTREPGAAQQRTDPGRLRRT